MKIRVEIISEEQLAVMLKRTGWTKGLLEDVLAALPNACEICGARWSCDHETSIHSAKAVTTEKVN